jgi:excisionase family DNA binding protein
MPCELTGQARIDAAKRRLADAIEELINATLSRRSSLSEWVSQHDSPLGRDRHLRLCRKGALRSVKDGRKRLVRRTDLDAYLLANAVIPTSPSREDDVDAMMRTIAGGRK